MAEQARIEIVKYEDWHGAHVANNIRMSDRREIYYLSTLAPWAAIKSTAALRVAGWACLLDGKPVCIFGVNRKTMISDIGVPWLLGTDGLDAYGVLLAMQSRVYIDRMAECFPLLENFALAENRSTLRYLKWLGFAMDDPAPAGPFGASFVRFYRGREPERRYLGAGAFRKKIKDAARAAKCA